MVGMIDVAKSSWLVMSGEEPLRASVTGAGWMGGWGKLEAGDATHSLQVTEGEPLVHLKLIRLKGTDSPSSQQPGEEDASGGFLPIDARPRWLLSISITHIPPG